VVRIDPTTSETRRYTLGHHVVGVAARGGVVAAGVQQSGGRRPSRRRIVYTALEVAISTPPATPRYAVSPSVRSVRDLCGLLNYRTFRAAGTGSCRKSPPLPAVPTAGRLVQIRSDYLLAAFNRRVTASVPHRRSAFCSRQPGPGTSPCSPTSARAYLRARPRFGVLLAATRRHRAIWRTTAGRLAPVFCAVPADWGRLRRPACPASASPVLQTAPERRRARRNPLPRAAASCPTVIVHRMNVEVAPPLPGRAWKSRLSSGRRPRPSCGGAAAGRRYRDAQ
jgi:hypothetical protein